MSFVLRPLSIDELKIFFDDNSIKILNYFIKKSIFSQPERVKWQRKLPIQVPKEHIEQWLVQSIWIDWIWAGSYALDVVNRANKWWADVKMLSAQTDDDWKLINWDTWETSLAQKFIETWSNLDNLFENKEFETIKTEWLTIYKNKLELVKDINKLDNIYYFILVRWWTKLYLLWMEVLLNNLVNTSVDIDRTDKPNTQSVFINWFLDNKYWFTKIYKAKKRLELRLKAKNWNDDNLCLVFDLDVDTEEIDFLELLKDEKFNINEYWIIKAKKLFWI